MRLSVILQGGIVGARSLPLAVTMASSLLVLSQLTAAADAPSAVTISAHPCSFAPPPEVGVWEATGAINDSGTYVRTEAATSPPDRPPFTNGPFRETFLFTGTQGTFTISAEERQTDNGQIGVWQIRPDGSGAYANASGHGTVAFSLSPTPNTCPPPFTNFTLSLVGVASKID
jgi:hypothetical protein